MFPRQYAPDVAAPFNQSVARAVAALLEPATNGAELHGNMSSPELGGGNDTLAALAGAYLDAVNSGYPPLDVDSFPQSQPTTPYVATVNLTAIFTNASWPYNTTLFPNLSAANLTDVDVALGADLYGLGSVLFGSYNYTSLTYMAQVGKPSLIRANFDNIFQGFITVFQVSNPGRKRRATLPTWRLAHLIYTLAFTWLLACCTETLTGWVCFLTLPPTHPSGADV